MSAKAGAKIAAAQRARWVGGRIYRIVYRGGAASRAGGSHSVSRWSVGHFISQFVPQEAGNTQLNAPIRSVFYSLSERLKPVASRSELDHCGRADTGRRKDIGGFLLGNFHKGLHHNRIELCAAVLYQTPPGFFMR